jgi:hypothetical protein
MKKNQLVTLWVITCCLLFSCHKPDFPGAIKGCQLIKIESRIPAIGNGYTYLCTYNNQRLLDTLKWGPDFLPFKPMVLDIQYNAQSLPVMMKDAFTNSKLIYQNGRIIRIDQLGTDNLYHVKYTFSSDAHGRIIERISSEDTVRWEYPQGNSRNFIRRIYKQVGKSYEWGLLDEYLYDHKVNPRATWPNMLLNPFSFEIYEFVSSSFEPIPENNWTYQKSIGRNGDGSVFNYQELFHSYEYDNVYPVLDHIRQVQHTPLNGDRETLSEIRYTYECKEHNNGHLQ